MTDMAFLKNQNVLFTVLLFVTAILVAQDIIIVDEEILVLLCFVLFIIFLSQNISEVISNELQSRASKIRDEFEETNLLQEDMYLTVLHYHNKQLSLQNEIQNIFDWTSQQMKELINTRSQALNHLLQRELEEKLKLIAMKEQSFLYSMQEETSSYLTSKVIANANQLDSDVISEGIQMIEHLAVTTSSSENQDDEDDDGSFHESNYNN